jgi:hypothetical protein
MIVQVIKEVPDDIFKNCLDELSKINWDNVIDERKQGVFVSSTAIHIRSPNTSSYLEKPNSIESYSKIVNCITNVGIMKQFFAHYYAAQWIKKQVGGISFGRIMIVQLKPNSKVELHVDPGVYFEKYSRYHIPFKTNKCVQFFNKENNKEHMPLKTLCRLNNLDYHGLINESNDDRIHLIVDVEVAGGNTVF